ncbi:MAG TPA: hypothetical protein VFX81_12550 [Burkholderiaceae bacterium]|nr:hypothetical protein [Burkholderiaceae bacterium]
MATALATARRWCNDSEYALVAASAAGKDIAWTPALLRAKIERTRRLRDKNRDAYRKLKRANRAATGAKSGKQVTAIAVAEKRAKIFDETLARFVAKLEKLNAAKRMKALKSAVVDALARKRTAQASAAGRARGAGAAGKAGRASKAGGPKAPVAGPVQVKRVRQMARVRARNVRNQARRDTRG